MKAPIGIYIHVPFCLSKCPYCDFYSVKFDDATADAYTLALCHAIEKSPYAGRRADTVYFGGGTPVLLGAKRLSAILEAVSKNFVLENPEVTLEANPAAVTKYELKRLFASGFNRISFGVQSGLDGESKALGRLHTAAEARQSIIEAHDAGFSNISADLMLGIPHQSKESLVESIDFLGGLTISHISAYMLKVEENTPFKRQNIAAICPDEDALAGMYLDCVKLLAWYGFEQYEISNFAKNGAKSRHNLKYWLCGEYLGFGSSAHSFMDGRRFYYPRDLDAFINAEDAAALCIDDGEGGGFEEYAMLRLRLTSGLDLNEAARLYGVDTAPIAKKAARLTENGLINYTNGIISLTPQGFLLSNSVTCELIL